MKLINDDPIIRCIERTGYPPWMLRGGRGAELCGTDRDTDGKDEDDE